MAIRVRTRALVALGAAVVGTIVAVAPVGASPASGTISTIAGAGVPDGSAATALRLRPANTAVLGGRLVVQESNGKRIRVVDLAAATERLVDFGALPAAGSAGDVAVGPDGAIYLAYGDRIARVGLDGRAAVIAGGGTIGVIGPVAIQPGLAIPGFSVDGIPATQADLADVTGLAVGVDGTVYFSEVIANPEPPEYARVRKVTPGGTLLPVAGTGAVGFAGDGGPAILAQLNRPGHLALDRTGNLYIADTYNNRVRRVTPSGTITTVPGTVLGRITGVAAETGGSLVLVDGAGLVRRVQPDGTVTTIAGLGNDPRPGYGDGGPAIDADFHNPDDVDVAGDGTLYVTEDDRVRAIDPVGTITTVVGGGPIGDGGPARTAYIGATAAAFDDHGRLVLAGDESDDPNTGDLVRRVESDATIDTIAGRGAWWEGSGDGGPALSANFSASLGALASDPAGDLYVADYNRVRVIDAAGTVHPYAGGGSEPADATLPATQVALGIVRSLAFDPVTNRLYIATGSLHYVDGAGLVHRVDTTGMYITDVAVDAQGNVIVGDYLHQQVWRAAPDGGFSVLAGTGQSGSTGDGGPALQATFRDVSHVAVGPDGSVYVADNVAYRVRRITPDGRIATVAGNGTATTSGDGGPATSAGVSLLDDLQVGSDGALYLVAVTVRRVEP